MMHNYSDYDKVGGSYSNAGDTPLELCSDFYTGTKKVVTVVVYALPSPPDYPVSFPWTPPWPGYQAMAASSTLVLLPSPPALTFGSALTATPMVATGSCVSGGTMFWLCWRSGTTDAWWQQVEATCAAPGYDKVVISAATSGSGSASTARC